MTLRTVVGALNKESIQALARLLNLVSAPIIISIGGIALNQFNTIIENQEKMFATQELHARKLANDSIRLNNIVIANRLFFAKQDAVIDALRVNSEIGIEFFVDYDKRRSELLDESKFLNP